MSYSFGPFGPVFLRGPRGRCLGRSFRGGTPLHAACYAGRDATARILVEDHAAPLNVKDEHGDTPARLVAALLAAASIALATRGTDKHEALVPTKKAVKVGAATNAGAPREAMRFYTELRRRRLEPPAPTLNALLRLSARPGAAAGIGRAARKAACTRGWPMG